MSGCPYGIVGLFCCVDRKVAQTLPGRFCQNSHSIYISKIKLHFGHTSQTCSTVYGVHLTKIGFWGPPGGVILKSGFDEPHHTKMNMFI